MESEDLLPWSQEHVTGRILSQINLVHILTPYFFKRSI
jgi:hypothetical protein